MKINKKRPSLPFMLAELTVASWETVLHRSVLIVQGNCSATEYQRMVLEKSRAAFQSARALAAPDGDVAAILAPWHSRAVANARRLRPK